MFPDLLKKHVSMEHKDNWGVVKFSRKIIYCYLAYFNCDFSSFLFPITLLKQKQFFLLKKRARMNFITFKYWF
jgi:hypothetical protein